MSRRSRTARGERAAERDARRESLFVLLAHAQRGALSTAEGVLLAEQVREEQRLADENRRAMASTTQALERHRKAADAAKIEAEERANLYRNAWRNARRRAREHQAEEERVRGWCGYWAARYREQALADNQHQEQRA